MLRLTRLGPLKWLALLDLGRLAYSHFSENMTPQDRARAAELARKSKGDPRKLTRGEKDELRAIARRLELKRLGRDVVPVVVRGRRRRR